MPIIDPDILKQTQEGSSLEEVRNSDGMTIGWKGKYCKDVFDNMTECLKENQKALRFKQTKAKGLNEHGQTKEQIKDLDGRIFLAEKRKETKLAAESLVAQND